MRSSNNIEDRLNQSFEGKNSQGLIKRTFNNTLANTKEYAILKKEQFLDLLQNTKAEILIGAGIALVGTAIYTTNYEVKQNHCLRLNFAETSQTERQARKLGINVPHFTQLLNFANDYNMKIFEAHNNSWELIPFISDNTETFSMFLDHHIDPSFKSHHYEIPQLTQAIPALCDSVMKELAYLKKLKTKADNTVKSLDWTWTEYHHDETHEELRSTTTCTTDANGHEDCTTSYYYETVYDWTDNSYTYYGKWGEKSSTLLSEMRIEFPKINYENRFMTATETGAENEYAMEKSREKDIGNKRLSQEEMLTYTNTNRYGSVLYINLNRIENLKGALAINDDQWKIHKKTARTYSQRTYDYSHAESKEFLTCQRAISNGVELSDAIDDLFRTIEYEKKYVIEETQRIKTFIKESYTHEGERRIKKQKKSIMSEAIKGHYKLFPKAIELEHSVWWHIPVYTLIATIIGGLIGGAVDYIGDKTDLYGTTRRRRREQWMNDNYNRFGQY